MFIWLNEHQFNLVYMNLVSVILRSNCKCLTFYWQVGGGHSTERHSSSPCYLLQCGSPVRHQIHIHIRGNELDVIAIYSFGNDARL